LFDQPPQVENEMDIAASSGDSRPAEMISRSDRPELRKISRRIFGERRFPDRRRGRDSDQGEQKSRGKTK